jgi:acrylyl-CoA reductase (NADPH)
MSSPQYRAIVIRQADDQSFKTEVENRTIDQLPAGEVLIRVHYSSLNFKDMLSANGHPAVTRVYPHQPGIDSAGVVEHSDSPDFKAGDEVITCGYDLGMGTAGGLGQYIRVPAKWVVKRPKNLTLKESMIFGTAGFTAALCIDKLERMGAKPADGKVAVTGASGGVGTMAIAQLTKLGYEAVAITGKVDNPALKDLGAVDVIHRDELLKANEQTMGLFAPAMFAHGIDCVAGQYLSGLLHAVDYFGSVACCGLASSLELNTSVVPFIIRNVNLLGIDCVELPLAIKQQTWEACADRFRPAALDTMAEEITLDEVTDRLMTIATGQSQGRYLVNLEK